MSTVGVVEDPSGLLARAFDRLAACPCWTVTLRAGAYGADMGARPGVQWMDTGDLFGLRGSAFLIRDGFAYLQGGMWQASLVGYTRSSDMVDAVIGDRWLKCDAAAFQRAGLDHNVLTQLAKWARPQPGQPVTVREVQETADGPVAVLVHDGLSAVLLSDSGPILIGLGSDPDGPVQADVSYDDAPLRLPDLRERGVISLAEAMAGFAALRRRPARSPSKKISLTPPTLLVSPGEKNGQTWSVRSDDLAAWGARSGYDIEEQTRELLATHDLDLLGNIEFDSNADSFLAYTASETAARALARELIKLYRG